VDEQLIAQGRLRRLASADEVVLVKRPPDSSRERTRRDPQLLVQLLLSPLSPSS
jgi:hypothetical protein